jgi:hypothetical protein
MLATEVPAPLRVYRPSKGHFQTEKLLRGIDDACFCGFLDSLVSERELLLVARYLRAYWPGFTDQWLIFPDQKSAFHAVKTNYPAEGIDFPEQGLDLPTKESGRYFIYIFWAGFCFLPDWDDPIFLSAG